MSYPGEDKIVLKGNVLVAHAADGVVLDVEGRDAVIDEGHNGRDGEPSAPEVSTGATNRDFPEQSS